MNVILLRRSYFDSQSFRAKENYALLRNILSFEIRLDQKVVSCNHTKCSPAIQFSPKLSHKIHVYSQEENFSVSSGYVADIWA